MGHELSLLIRDNDDAFRAFTYRNCSLTDIHSGGCFPAATQRKRTSVNCGRFIRSS